MLATGVQWPPDRHRIEAYRRFESLYEGDHRAAFIENLAIKLYDKGRDGLTNLILDYPKSIVDIPAELLVSSPPIISYEDPEMNSAWQEIAERSQWDAALLELSQDTNMRGDGVIEVRNSADGVVVETKPAYCYFPSLSPSNVRVVTGEALAWTEKFDGSTIVRVDRYAAGTVAREAYRLDGVVLGQQLYGSDLGSALGGVEQLDSTGVERSTLVHVPNTRSSNKYFGHSDLGGGLPTLFEEVNERISQISRILDKHASPKMAGPSSLIGADGRVNLRGDFFGVSSGADPPLYLTWNAQLEAAFRALDAVIDEILKHSKISKLLMGFVNGASYDSARAYKMQLAPTLAKVAKKGIYLDGACRVAVRLAVAMRTGRTYAATPTPNIRWRDGLPKDLAELSTTNATRIANSTLSRRTAAMAEMDCDEATADAELAMVEAEQERFGGASMPVAVPEITTPEFTGIVTQGSGEAA